MATLFKSKREGPPSLPKFLRTNADNRLSHTPLGRVEGGDASSRLDTLPIFVRSRPFRMRWTISQSLLLLRSLRGLFPHRHGRDCGPPTAAAVMIVTQCGYHRFRCSDILIGTGAALRC